MMPLPSPQGKENENDRSVNTQKVDTWYVLWVSNTLQIKIKLYI